MEPRRVTQTFYRYQRDDGTVVIVDSPSKLPPEARRKAQRVELDARPSQSAEGALPGAFTDGAVARDALPSEGGHLQLDAPSFGFGMGAGVLLTTVAVGLLRWTSRGGALPRRLLVSLVVLGLVAGAGSAYLGWLRRTTGQGDDAFASPSRVIDDAKKAADGVQRARREQERQLQELEKLSR